MQKREGALKPSTSSYWRGVIDKLYKTSEGWKIVDFKLAEKRADMAEIQVPDGVLPVPTEEYARPRFSDSSVSKGRRYGDGYP